MNTKLIDTAGIASTAITLPTILQPELWQSAYVFVSSFLSVAWLAIKVYNEYRDAKGKDRADR